jgi:hypothetical protein
MMAITVHHALVHFYVHTIFVTRGAAWKEEKEKKIIRGGSKKGMIDDGECFIAYSIRVRAASWHTGHGHGARRRLFHP